MASGPSKSTVAERAQITHMAASADAGAAERRIVLYTAAAHSSFTWVDVRRPAGDIGASTVRASFL
jgi:hypothetical protein